jgi:hypothetical protein
VFLNAREVSGEMRARSRIFSPPARIAVMILIGAVVFQSSLFFLG